MPKVVLDEAKEKIAQLVQERGGNKGGNSKDDDQKSGAKKPGVCYMSDGTSKVDYVLVYDPEKTVDQKKRDIFEEELVAAGFVLECVGTRRKRNRLKFVKISAPFEVLTTYAEILRFKMPIKQSFLVKTRAKPAAKSEVPSYVPSPLRKAFVNADEDPKKKGASGKRKHLAMEFSKAREYMYDIPEVKEDFFTAAQRSHIVRYILQRKPFSREDSTESFDFGIDRLLDDRVYLAAYPLHEGSATEKDGSFRQELLDKWASLAAALTPQPLEDVRRYFGVKVGLYFAWLGFYTYMLIPVSVVGLMGFVYGVMTVHKYEPNIDVCQRFKDIVMCPTCETGCGFWKLEENCKQTLMAYLFDNNAVFLFTIFIVIWSAAFLELWKRYSSRITYQWDLTGFDTMEEVPRTEYVANLVLEERKKLAKRAARDAGVDDFKKSAMWRRKLPNTYYSFSLILLVMILCLATAFGVWVYKLGYSLVAAMSSSQSIINMGAAFINFATIIAFDQPYQKLAVRLTDLEMPRTQSEYDDSLMLKQFLLKFISCFAWLLYVIIYRGYMPGDDQKRNPVLGNYQHEACGTSGCTQEIATGLAVLMLGSQLFAAIVDALSPYVNKFLYGEEPDPRDSLARSDGDSTYSESTPISDPVLRLKVYGAYADDERPWERDFCLPDLGRHGIFYENLDLAIQYGYVTLFVTAFPLAPIFALINNVFEIRIHAGRLLLQHRRPAGQRVKNLGMMFSILETMGNISVFTNAIIIAFTSDFIPRLYYRYKHAPDHNMVGYANFSLSYFDVNHTMPTSVYTNYELLKGEQYCRYRDFRAPPWDERKYRRNLIYWEILAWRLIFIIAFENIILLLIKMIRWLIPDVPRSIQTRFRDDYRQTNELIIQHELERRQLARGTRTTITREVPTQTETSTLENFPSMRKVAKEKAVKEAKPSGFFSNWF